MVGPWSSSASWTGRCEVGRKIVLRNNFQRLLKNFPQLDCLVIGREEVVRCILSPTPLNLIDFFFNLQGLQVVEFGFM